MGHKGKHHPPARGRTMFASQPVYGTGEVGTSPSEVRSYPAIWPMRRHDAPLAQAGQYTGNAKKTIGRRAHMRG